MPLVGLGELALGERVGELDLGEVAIGEVALGEVALGEVALGEELLAAGGSCGVLIDFVTMGTGAPLSLLRDHAAPDLALAGACAGAGAGGGEEEAAVKKGFFVFDCRCHDSGASAAVVPSASARADGSEGGDALGGDAEEEGEEGEEGEAVAARPGTRVHAPDSLNETSPLAA